MACLIKMVTANSINWQKATPSLIKWIRKLKGRNLFVAYKVNVWYAQNSCTTCRKSARGRDEFICACFTTRIHFKYEISFIIRCRRKPRIIFRAKTWTATFPSNDKDIWHNFPTFRHVSCIFSTVKRANMLVLITRKSIICVWKGRCINICS